MNSFIIFSNNTQKIDEKVKEIVKKNQATALNLELKTIETARQLKKLTKLSYQQKLAVIIKEAEKASLPALNAILKNIEEPGKNIIFILTTKNIKAVIPTVVSRCQVIRLNAQEENFSTDYSSFLNQKIGLKLLHTSKIKEREEALEFLKNLIQFCRKTINQKNNNLKIARCLIYSSQVFSAIKSNGNVKLQLTKLVINL